MMSDQEILQYLPTNVKTIHREKIGDMEIIYYDLGENNPKSWWTHIKIWMEKFQ